MTGTTITEAMNRAYQLNSLIEGAVELSHAATGERPRAANALLVLLPLLARLSLELAESLDEMDRNRPHDAAAAERILMALGHPVPPQEDLARILSDGADGADAFMGWTGHNAEAADE